MSQSSQFLRIASGEPLPKRKKNSSFYAPIQETISGSEEEEKIEYKSKNPSKKDKNESCDDTSESQEEEQDTNFDQSHKSKIQKKITKISYLLTLFDKLENGKFKCTLTVEYNTKGTGSHSNIITDESNIAHHLRRWHQKAYNMICELKSTGIEHSNAIEKVKRSWQIKQQRVTLQRFWNQLQNTPRKMHVEIALLMWAVDAGISFHAFTSNSWKDFLKIVDIAIHDETSLRQVVLPSIYHLVVEQNYVDCHKVIYLKYISNK